MKAKGDAFKYSGDAPGNDPAWRVVIAPGHSRRAQSWVMAVSTAALVALLVATLPPLAKAAASLALAAAALRALRRDACQEGPGAVRCLAVDLAGRLESSTPTVRAPGAGSSTAPSSRRGSSSSAGCPTAGAFPAPSSSRRMRSARTNSGGCGSSFAGGRVRYNSRMISHAVPAQPLLTLRGSVALSPFRIEKLVAGLRPGLRDAVCDRHPFRPFRAAGRAAHGGRSRKSSRRILTYGTPGDRGAEGRAAGGAAALRHGLAVVVQGHRHRAQLRAGRRWSAWSAAWPTGSR